MPWNGSGTATRIYNWTNDANASIPITASRMDGDSNDFVSMINNCRAKDGQNAATANLPMGGFIHTGVGNATARNQYPAVGQIQDGSVIWCGTAGGTANAITLTPSPAITAYAAGQRFAAIIALTNTSTTTVAVSGLPAKNAYKRTHGGAVACDGGELIANNIGWFEYDGTQFQILPDCNVSPFIGTAAPASPYAWQIWGDTTTVTFKRRNAGNTAFKYMLPGATTMLVTRSLNTIFAASDFGTTILFSSSFTQTFTAAATLTDGWWINLRNSGTGVITLDPNASETIDGSTTLSMSPGESFAVWCDGANFYTIGRGVGTVVQAVNTETGAVATGSTSIPSDDTIPQNTEGDQYLSQAITPTSASNKLLVEALLTLSTASAGYAIAALFQDLTANALAAATSQTTTANGLVQVFLRHEMTSGTVSSTTFKIRAGCSAGGTVTLNGVSAARKLGGVLLSWIRVTEFRQ